MEEFQSQESFAEKVFRELRKTIPDVSLGFPPTGKMQRRRADRLESERSRLLHRQEVEDCEFQRLKEAALAQIRKDHR
jgi:aminoglycoside phosphotransferase